MSLSGKEKEAGARFERAYKLDDSALRVSDAYARWLSRNKDAAAATAVYEAFDKKLRAASAGGGRPPRNKSRQEDCRRSRRIRSRPARPRRCTVSAPSLTRRGGEDLALVYLQLALYLQPEPSAGAAVARRPL
jgi:hypothetical protein